MYSYHPVNRSDFFFQKSFEVLISSPEGSWPLLKMANTPQEECWKLYNYSYGRQVSYVQGTMVETVK